ncbi:type IV toxin-antitoxin system AbiEi family antitoxin domain-containing protein [Arthrobacter sp. MMS18-M83]|uniref:type IV toxin-antitoxin system AbiEi family antitoxin domain-containing protein n=1 Tax=Arthrobacter sp. MMS18-M83 TaxID=2996261 RepID=UPI00227B7E9F|nr:type IV toxin-antitoxin system AbiEi family antitoxin domain-containing protein [Arthrobacter sp. MMS18-M83]WAH95678.1 type IV toxin-antitoxin system AbiEi family antitoxin domain-containing protein [Arthrobacter sp. MMS18-M83]
MTIQQALWETAVDQYGYVTTRDAQALGIPVVELAKLSHRGQLTRVAHGTYRFDRLPPTDRDEYALAVLWPGVEGAALAHDTALAVYELCDINPSKIHVVVPKGKRIRRSGGSKYVIHHEDLTEGQLGWWEGIRTVTPLIAIAQGIRSGVPAELIEQAIKAAEARGFIRTGDRIRFANELKDRR